MPELQLFNFDAYTTIRTACSENGEPLVCAADLAKEIGLRKAGDAYDRIDDDFKVVRKTATSGGAQMMLFLTKEGVDQLKNGARNRKHFDSKVYFVRCLNTGLIKIGFTNNPKQRLRNIVTSNSTPTEALKVIDGSTILEADLHRKYAHLRHHGEWFSPGADLLDFINDHNQENN